MRPGTTATGWRPCDCTSRYTLTEPEEKIINLKDVNGVKALVQPVRHHHQPLHLQAGGGWPGQGTDPGRADGLRPGIRPGPARGGLPGAIPGLRPGPAHPGPDLPVHAARLAQRAPRPAQASSRPLRCATWPTMCRTRWWIPCWRLPGERRSLPALFPAEGQMAGSGPAAPLRYLCARWRRATRRYDYAEAVDMVLEQLQRVPPESSGAGPAGASTSAIWTARCARASAAAPSA